MQTLVESGKHECFRHYYGPGFFNAGALGNNVLLERERIIWHNQKYIPLIKS